jgi:aspartate aminotransferase-like enzyme
MSHTKLFIPGPVEVHPDVLAAMARPMIGHRTQEFKDLYAALRPKLQALFKTDRPVLISTSSATGVMEAGIRNLVKKKLLALVCGAFSERWADIAEACGRSVDRLEVPWGEAVDVAALKEALASGGYDAVTLVHNETSCGVMNPLAEVAAVVREHEDVMLLVDTVSSFSAVDIPFDDLGIDLCLAGVQKALSLPPGITVFALSERAVERVKDVPDRGFYFDFTRFLSNDAKDFTVTTPSISHIYALDAACDRMLAEGLDVRYARHREMQEMAHDWIADNGFALLPTPEHASVTLSTIQNTREISIPDLNGVLRDRYGFIISGGYGQIKETTFRIAHMGDTTPELFRTVLDQVSEGIATL